MPKAATKSAPVARVEVPPSAPDTPVHTITYGNVRGKIWKNAKDPYFVTLERFERGKTTDEVIFQAFPSGQLRHLAKVASDCQKWVAWQESRQTSAAR